jgi:CspA family cold shock protein
MDNRMIGEVKWFNNDRGYGFIVDEDGEEDGNPVEYFVHYTSVQMDGYKTLKTGQKVSFILEDTPKGIQAKEVEIED